MLLRCSNDCLIIVLSKSEIISPSTEVERILAGSNPRDLLGEEGETSTRASRGGIFQGGFCLSLQVLKN